MPDKPTPEQFAQDVAARLVHSETIEGEFVFNQDRYSLTLTDEDGRPTTEIFLKNYYDEFCASDEDGREAVLARAAAMTRKPPDFDGIDFRSRLLPQIKDRWSVEQMNMSLLAGRYGPPAEASTQCLPYGVIGHHFALTVAYDLPDKIAHVNYKQLEEWGIDFQEALDIAANNLMERTQWEFEFAQDAEGKTVFAASHWHDDYDLARLIFSDQLKQLDFPGDLIIGLLNANYMFLTGTESEQGLVYLLSEMVASQSEPRSMPPFALQVNSEGMGLYIPPLGHALQSMFIDMQREYIVNLYKWQRELLEGECQALVEGHSVANFEQGEIDGHRESFCYVFAEHIPTFLPSAVDTVVFQKDGTVTATTWERFIDVMESHLRGTSFYAPLAMLLDFPTDEELARLKIE